MKSGRVIISAPKQDFKLHKSERGGEGKGRESSECRGNVAVKSWKQVWDAQTQGHISGRCWVETRAEL